MNILFDFWKSALASSGLSVSFCVSGTACFCLEERRALDAVNTPMRQTHRKKIAASAGGDATLLSRRRLIYHFVCFTPGCS